LKQATYIFLIFLSVTFFASCKDTVKEEEEKNALVIADKEFLSQEDLDEKIIDTGNPKDSVGMQKKVIEEWGKESLFYQEAMTKLKEEEIQVDKQVAEYRKDLVNYIYQTKIIEANLDTNVNNGEVEEYYNENKESFILKDNIVKVNYFKIPLKAQALNKMKGMIYSTKPKDKENLIALCSQYAENFFVNDSTWLYLDDVKKEIPKLREQDDIYIYAGRIMEINDDEFYYFLRIKELKSRNSVSPLNFEKQNIKKMIVNQRKTQLIRQYKQQLLEKAIEEKRFRMNKAGSLK
jgi:hypothetical protein